PPLVSLDQSLFFTGFEIRVRDFPRLVLHLWLRGVVAFRAAGRQEAHEPAADRRQRPRDEAERRQQHREDRLRIPPDDQCRQHMLAYEDVDGHAGEQNADRCKGHPRSPRQDGEQHGRKREDDPEQKTRRDEELHGVVEIEPEAVVAAALGHQTQRQLHERTERGLDGADVDRGDAEKKQQERDHLLVLAGAPPPARGRAAVRLRRTALRRPAPAAGALSLLADAPPPARGRAAVRLRRTPLRRPAPAAGALSLLADAPPPARGRAAVRLRRTALRRPAPAAGALSLLADAPPP